MTLATVTLGSWAARYLVPGTWGSVDLATLVPVERVGRVDPADFSADSVELAALEPADLVPPAVDSGGPSPTRFYGGAEA